MSRLDLGLGLGCFDFVINSRKGKLSAERKRNAVIPGNRKELSVIGQYYVLLREM